MSQTREVPPTQWNEFLSTLAEGHPRVRVRIEGEELGYQKLVDQAALRRFEVDEKGPDGQAIELEVGEVDAVFSHRIEHPEHVWVEESEDGVARVVNIEDEGHTKTLVSLESEASPF